MTVRVPVPRSLKSDSGKIDYLTASFARDPSRTALVERGGALARSRIPVERDPTLLGFRAACARADCEVPADTRIRVVAAGEWSDARSDGERIEASLAGAIGARALLDLPLDDDVLIALVAGDDHATRRRAAAAIAVHAIVSQTLCDA